MTTVENRARHGANVDLVGPRRLSQALLCVASALLLVFVGFAATSCSDAEDDEPKVNDRTVGRARDRAVSARSTFAPCRARFSTVGIIDEILPEPLGGAHRDHAAAARNLKQAVLRHLGEIRDLDEETLRHLRYQKFKAIGVFVEEGKSE